MSRHFQGSGAARLVRRTIASLALLTPLLLAACGGERESIPYSELKAHIAAGDVASVRVSPGAIVAEPTAAARKSGAPAAWDAVPLQEDAGLVTLLDAHHVVYQGGSDRPGPLVAIPILLGALTIVFGVGYLQRRNATAGLHGVARLRVRNAGAGHAPGDRFEDVAGADEVKEELEELVAFLKRPERFRRLGVHVPKGVLLVGPPGTGKTLLARAVAGEAGVPFFSMSGSAFVEVYVGVGAARVRKLFHTARGKAPCIVFIDELDAIGKSRAGGPAANDEREQALNQLLVSMDGFEASAGVIVMAATNRPEILDPALLRPGRFDRQVALGRPDAAGREAILRVHGRRIRVGAEVDFGDIAGRTAGFTGADLANVLNEAGLVAARRDGHEIGMADIDAAIDRVVAGIEKKSRLLNPKERRIVAYHEAGHAIVGCASEQGEAVKKVSIVPRGLAALGYTQHVPEDRNLLQLDELHHRLDVLLGGRAAELVAFGKVSTGAMNDLERASDLARRMVTEFGMSDALGPVAYATQGSPLLGGKAERDCSDDTSRRIDAEVQRLVSDAFERSCRLLQERRDLLERVATQLLEVETIDGAQLRALVAEDEALRRLAVEA